MNKVRTVRMSLLMFLTFILGLAIGNQWTFRWMMETLTTETQGGLAQRVEGLARIRTGDIEGGVVFLEEALDRAFVTLPQGREWSELPEDLKSTLMIAKAYRTVFPPPNPNDELMSRLSEVRLPKAEYCSPAMKDVLELLRAQEN